MVVVLCLWQSTGPIPRQNLLWKITDGQSSTAFSTLKSNCKFPFKWRATFLHVNHTKCFSCTSESSSQRTRRIFILNTSLLHLMDDIFWNMGFKNAEAADKVVMSSLLLFLFILIILIICTGSNFLGRFSRWMGRTSQHNCRHNRFTGQWVP